MDGRWWRRVRDKVAAVGESVSGRKEGVGVVQQIF